MTNVPPIDTHDIDSQQLKLLSIFHYIAGGLAALFACFPIIHLVIGLFLIIAPGNMGAAGNAPPPFIGWFFVVISAFVILAGWLFALLMLITGRFISQRKHYTFCLVMACVECIFVPFGTVLGIFTVIVLVRPSAKLLFAPRAS